MGECFKERKERSCEGELLSVTINSGIKKFSELDRKNNSSKDKGNYKCVNVGDIAYNSMRMWQGACGISKYKGIVSPAYTVLIPNENINPEFFGFLFKKNTTIQVFQKHSQGMTSDTWNLKYPAFSKIKVFKPLKKEQDEISRLFLNLDQLITFQQRSFKNRIFTYKLMKIYFDKRLGTTEVRRINK